MPRVTRGLKHKAPYYFKFKKPTFVFINLLGKFHYFTTMCRNGSR